MEYSMTPVNRKAVKNSGEEQIILKLALFFENLMESDK